MKVAAVLAEGNPLGSRADTISDLGDRIEAIDLIMALGVFRSFVAPEKIVSAILNQGFDLSLKPIECVAPASSYLSSLVRRTNASIHVRNARPSMRMLGAKVKYPLRKIFAQFSQASSEGNWIRIEINRRSDSDVTRRSINCDADAAAALIIRSKFRNTTLQLCLGRLWKGRLRFINRTTFWRCRS